MKLDEALVGNRDLVDSVFLAIFTNALVSLGDDARKIYRHNMSERVKIKAELEKDIEEAKHEPN